MTAMNVRADEPKSAGLDEALAAIVRRFRADSGTVHFLQQDGLLHLSAATAGLPAGVLATIAAIPVGKGMAGLAVERGRPVDACNIQTDASGDVRPGARATGLGGAVVVPIFRGEAIVGALGIGTRSERAFTDAEMQDLIAEGRQLP
jgi:L-methionine (R)-S-oxide reductase